MTKRPVQKVIAVALALMLVTGGVSVAVQMGHSDSSKSPVGSADALGLDTVHKVAAVVATGVAAYGMDLYGAQESVAGQEEVIQQKIDLYQLANTQKENSEIVVTQARNQLQGSDTLLKMEGVNELQQAASSDVSQSEATSRVTSRIDNRTAKKQINVLNAWSAAAQNVRYIENVSDNSTGISDSFAKPAAQVVSQDIKQNLNNPQLDASVSVEIRDSVTDWSHSVTLANGSTYNITRIPVAVTDTSDYTDDDGYDNRNQQTQNGWISPFSLTVQTGGEIYYPSANEHRSDYTVTAEVTPYVVTRNQSSEADSILTGSGDQEFANATQFAGVHSDIESQNNQATQAVTDLAAAKYSGLRDGTIPINQTISPYYADHLYSMEDDSSTWLMNMHAAMGAGNPAELDNVTTMTVTSGASVYDGVLMSDGLPANNTFHVGHKYYPSNLSGNQFVVTESGAKYQLTAPFVIQSIEGPDGNLSTVTYEKPTYNVTSIDGFKAMTEYLLEKRAESEAREKNKEGGAGAGGGAALFGGNSNLVVAIVALIAIAAMVREDDGPGGGRGGRY